MPRTIMTDPRRLDVLDEMALSMGESIHGCSRFPQTMAALQQRGLMADGFTTALGSDALRAHYAAQIDDALRRNALPGIEVCRGIDVLLRLSTGLLLSSEDRRICCYEPAMKAAVDQDRETGEWAINEHGRHVLRLWEEDNASDAG